MSLESLDPHDSDVVREKIESKKSIMTALTVIAVDSFFSQ